MNDRLDKYFVKYLDEYVFLELMPDYVKREHLDFMRNVPMPVKKEQVGNLAGSQGIEFKNFTLGMINIIGINPSFKFVTKYVHFLNYVNSDINKAILAVGLGLANNGDLEEACITLRAALVIDPDDIDALYNYMLVCRNLYIKSTDSEYTADFKTEVFESLLKLKELSPDFPMVYYYLGFAYINAGKYSDAQREWLRFMEIGKSRDDLKEIEQRLKDIEEPVRIERGYTEVMSGNWQHGLGILEEYKNTEMMEWWPLPYYLGVGYNRTGRSDEALVMLKKALEGNPSSPEIVAELIIANNELGDEVNGEKYKRKLEALRSRSDNKNNN